LQTFFDAVNTCCAAKATSRYYRWSYLEYHGRPWLGELWLDDTLRLGPPSVQYDKAVYGPRAVIVSAAVEAVSEADASIVFRGLLTELSLFLSVVMKSVVQITDQSDAVWTSEIGADGKTVCSVRNLGYFELGGPLQMPARGVVQPVPLYSITRPCLSEHYGMEDQATLPADVGTLWAHYQALKSEQKSKFLQVAAKWQEALIHWKNRGTLSFTLLVVACEALKPSERDFNDHTINEVAGALLNDTVSERLKQDWFRAHYMRSQHLHLGEVRYGELQPSSMRDFFDPTLREAHWELSRVVNAAIIEWLSLRGDFTLPPLTSRPAKIRRFIRENMSSFLVVTFALGAAIGWLLRSF
jgi:hypothetical protein